jgi:hypothetical protein
MIMGNADTKTLDFSRLSDRIAQRDTTLPSDNWFATCLM